MDNERSRITQQAALALLQAEASDSAETRSEFLAFARGSVNNVRELLLAQATLKAFESVDPEKAIDLRALPKLPELSGSVRELDTAKLPPAAGRRRYWIAAAAAIGLVCFGWLLVAGFWQPSPVYTTAVGEQRLLRLDDGSTVVLNTDSRVRIDYSDKIRQVQLLEGEALFQVAFDAARPFQVFAEGAVVQALGTQFNVYRYNGTTRVAVIEGAVQVAATVDAAGPGSVMRLDAGDEAELSRAKITRTHKPDVSRVVAWRSRLLMFDNQTLEHVAAQFNRYNRSQLKIEGEALRALPISGTFDVDDVEPVVGFITRTPGLNAEVERGDGEIVIRQR